MGKVPASTGKEGVGKSIFPAQCSWRAVEAARQVSFQVLSGGFQREVSLIENEDLVRVSEAKLNEGHRPVRSDVVNNRIAVVALGTLLDSAFCGENNFVVPHDFYGCLRAVGFPPHSILTRWKICPLQNDITGDGQSPRVLSQGGDAGGQKQRHRQSRRYERLSFVHAHSILLFHLVTLYYYVAIFL